MNFLERAAMKILERGLKPEKRIRTADADRKEHTGSIVLPETYSPAEIERMEAELVYYRRLAAQRQTELLEIQKTESLGNIEEHHRTKQIRMYLSQIEALNLRTPGGLRSQPRAEDGEDQELVNEAWLIFCGRRKF